MSDILIKGMEMPKSCWECEVGSASQLDNKTCPFYAMEGQEQENYQNKIAEGCPLVEIPPHGRLIDSDALMREFEKAQRTMEQHGQEYSCSFMSSSQELSTEWYCVEDMLENAPTIIPAEEGET
jgi:hypothetical protein